MSDEEVTTTVRFTVVDEATGLSFTDAISVPGNLTDSEMKRARAGIEREKAARFAAWKAAISTPAPAPDPVAELASVAEQAAALEDRKTVLVETITADPELAARADEDPAIAAVIDQVQAQADAPVQG